MKTIVIIAFLSFIAILAHAQTTTATIDQIIQLRQTGKDAQAKKVLANALNNLPKDEFKIRELAGYCYQYQAFDLATSIFLQGRKTLENNQAFAYELIRMYQLKKDKNMLILEFLNAFETMPELLLQAESILGAVFENNADYQLLQAELLKKIQKDPTKEVYNQLLIWQYLQQQDYEMALRQLIAQDRRTKDDGGVLYNTIPAFIANQAYPTAIKAYEYLLTKGKENEYYLPARVELINTRYQQLDGKPDQTVLTELAAAYDSILKEYGKTPQTLFALKKLAYLQAYYLNNPQAAEKSLEEALQIPGISPLETGVVKLDLGDIYILTQQPWEAILVYEQVATQYEGQPIGNEARFRATRLSFYQGNFAYAKSQADVLKASTSQLIANDALNLSLLISDNLQSATDSLALKMYADAELLNFQNQTSRALLKLDSIPVAYPNNSLLDDIIMLKSKIYLKNNDFKSAVNMLKEIIAQHTGSIWTDDAIFTLGNLYENKLNDPEQAKILYQKLISDFPGSMYTTEARKRFRKLRGDNVGT